MDFIKGYKSQPYPDVQKELLRKFDLSGKGLPELAMGAEVESTQTIKFALESVEQKVSDRVLTSVANSLEFNMFIVWINGEKHYFVKEVKNKFGG